MKDSQIDTDVTARPAMAPCGDDFFAVCWGTELHNGDLFGAIYAQNLSAIAPKFAINTTDQAATSQPVMCIVVGGFAVAWSTTRDVFVQSFDGDGSATSAVVQVNTDPADSAHPPAITMLADGSVVVSWGDARGFVGVRAQHFSQTFAKIGVEFAVNTSPGVHSMPVIAALDDGGYVIGWQGGSNTSTGRFRMFNPDGSGSTGELLSKFGLEPVASTLAAVPQGQFACVHIQASPFGPDHENILAVSLYGRDGSFVGDVPITPQGSKTISSNPVIKALPISGLIVTWTQRPVPATGQFGNQIRAMVLGDDLTPGVSATVNLAPPAGQDDACMTPVVTDSGGSFMAFAWVEIPLTGQPGQPDLVYRTLSEDLLGD